MFCFWLLLLFIPVDVKSSPVSCNFTTNTKSNLGADDLANCLRDLKKNISMKGTVIDATNKKLQLGGLEQDDVNKIFKVEELRADGVTLKRNPDSRISYKTLKLKIQKLVWRNNKPKNFFILHLEDWPLLQSFEIENNTIFKNITIRLFDCPRLKLEDLNILRKLSHPKDSYVPQYGSIYVEKGYIKSSWNTIDSWANILYGNIIIENDDLTEGHSKSFGLSPDSSLVIRNTHLTTIDFMKIPPNLTAECGKNRQWFKNVTCEKNLIINNDKLCLTEANKRELKQFYPNIKISKNDDSCKHECDWNLFISDRLPYSKVCYSFRGEVYFDNSTLLTAKQQATLFHIYVIRGNLRIMNTSINYWDMLEHLWVIDNGNSTQPALEINNVIRDHKNWEFFYPTNFVRVMGETKEGRRVRFVNRPFVLLEEDEDYLKRISYFSDEYTEDRTPPTMETAKEKIIRKEKLNPKYLYIIASVACCIIVFGLLIVIIYLLYRCYRAKHFHLPCLLIPDAKKALLQKLAVEIVQKNPMEWKESQEKEVTQVLPSKERDGLAKTLRNAYSKFVDEMEKRPVITIRFDSPGQEIFKLLKKIYDETEGETELILMSKEEEPSMVNPIFGKERGKTETLTGTVAAMEKFTTSSKSSNKDQMQNSIFQIDSVFLRKKKYNKNINIYSYRIKFNLDGGSPIAFQLQLVHYHGWTEITDDKSTALRLLEYGRKKEGKMKPFYATSNPSQSFTTLMMTALVYHIFDVSYSEMAIENMKTLVGDLIDFQEPDIDWLLYFLMNTVRWAADKRLIPMESRQAYNDFQLLYTKMKEYGQKNPNNLFFTVTDLNLEPADLIRVQETARRKKEELEHKKAMEETNEATISTKDFKKQSDIVHPPTNHNK